MEGEGFLKQKFNVLHTSPEVESAINRQEKITGEKVEQKPERKIQVYLDRFSEILNKEGISKERAIDALKKVFFKKSIIAEEDIPERVYELEQEIAFNQGHGRVEITDEYKKSKNQEIIDGQRESLSTWIDYLTSNDAMYPMWAKYWTMNSVLKVGKYNKEKKAFDKRGKDSVAPFPPMNIGAVAKTISIIEDIVKNESSTTVPNFSSVTDEVFQKVLNTTDFAKIYALALESMPEFSEKGLEVIEGEWVVYPQIPYQDRGEDNLVIHPQTQKLFDSLQGYPLEWCTASNINTAETQLSGGDFYVYYSKNAQGENKIPRVAIRMEGEHIGEVRGIDTQQEMDRYILPVVEEKMDEFGEEGERYKTKVEDMKMLTEIYNKSFNLENSPYAPTPCNRLNSPKLA